MTNIYKLYTTATEIEKKSKGYVLKLIKAQKNKPIPTRDVNAMHGPLVKENFEYFFLQLLYLFLVYSTTFTKAVSLEIRAY